MCIKCPPAPACLGPEQMYPILLQFLLPDLRLQLLQDPQPDGQRLVDVQVVQGVLLQHQLNILEHARLNAMSAYHACLTLIPEDMETRSES